jgi:hypothetical protein
MYDASAQPPRSPLARLRPPSVLPTALPAHVHSPLKLSADMLSVSTFLPLALLASFLAAPALASVIDPLARRTKSAHDKYTTAHSLGEDYNFHSRDGWMTLNFTDPHPSSRRADPVLPAGAAHTSYQSFEEHWLAERTSGNKHGSSKKKGSSIDAGGNIAHPKILAAEPVDGILGEVSQALHPVGEAEDVIITW